MLGKDFGMELVTGCSVIDKGKVAFESVHRLVKILELLNHKPMHQMLFKGEMGELFEESFTFRSFGELLSERSEDWGLSSQDAFWCEVRDQALHKTCVLCIC